MVVLAHNPDTFIRINRNFKRVIFMTGLDRIEPGAIHAHTGLHTQGAGDIFGSLLPGTLATDIPIHRTRVFHH